MTGRISAPDSMPFASSAARTASHWPKCPETSSAPRPAARACSSASQPGPVGPVQAPRAWKSRRVITSIMVRPNVSAIAERMRRRSAAGIVGKISRRLPSTRRAQVGHERDQQAGEAEAKARRAR